MTNGTSQGLFVVVAIVIFGIFVLISYLLFRDNLKPSLGGIFTDGLEQAKCAISNEDESNPICNPKFNNSHEFLSSGSVGIEFVNKLEDGSTPNSGKTINIWKSGINQGIPEISISEYKKKFPHHNIIVENNMVLMGMIFIKQLHVKNSFLTCGYQVRDNSDIYISINNNQLEELGPLKDNLTLNYRFNYYLEIGKTNSINIKYINSYGGVSNFEFQVKILP